MGTRSRAGLLAFAFVAMGACGGSGSPIVAPAGPVPGGTIKGIYVEEKSDHSARHAVDGVTIGAYAKQFLPGANQLNPPPPVATATTASGGLFSITGLAPGRYFLTPTVALAFGSTFAEVSATQGASVVLTACSDCPLPQ